MPERPRNGGAFRLRHIVAVLGVVVLVPLAAPAGGTPPGPERRAGAASPSGNREGRPGSQPGKASGESRNKRTVRKYMEAFNRTDHAAILSCLTDDVEWVVPGAFHARGKASFDREIENDAFTGSPAIRVTRLTEENDVVVAEGSVRSTRKAGGTLNLVFCDVFVMRDGKIRHLTSYLMEVRQ